MELLDGKKVSEKILNEVKASVCKLDKKPHLVVILIGDDPASKIYVKNKQKAAEKVGIKSTIYEFDKNIKEYQLLNKIDELNVCP